MVVLSDALVDELQIINLFCYLLCPFLLSWPTFLELLQVIFLGILGAGLDALPATEPAVKELS